MKELSIEEKAKAYDGNYKTYTELINRLEDVKNAIKKQNYGIAMDILYKPYPEYQITAFPELAESEDERIRKGLISYFGDFHLQTFAGLDPKKILTWLEKQGEQKTIDEIAKEVCKNKISAITFLKSAGIINEKGELAEQYRQDEQKSADKVKPKFHEDDWVVYCGKTCKITGLHNGIFTITNQDGSYFFNQVESTTEPVWHLWTIQDAKDGDVLACGNDIVIFKENSYNPKDKSGCMFVHCSCNNFYEIGGINPTDYKPATKEQRDLLFSKMKEAGYEWDAEKKELKKIEQKPATWSEEDEDYYDAIIAKLEVTQDDALLTDNQMEFLKSLKDRYTWKPSNEQMKGIECTIKTLRYQLNAGDNRLDSLYNDLKKLRGK